MADPLENTVNRALGLAVGQDESSVDPDAGTGFFSWVTKTGDLIPGWWSTARDRALGKVWKESNHLSIAVYNTQAKIVGIPPVIVPRDPTNDKHLDQAETLESVLFTSSDFGQGWAVTYAKFIENLITQDNGAFMEIIGEGDPAGPIIGTPVSIRHLDSSRCIRTGHPIFPVKYMDDTGKLFKIHRTRVIYMSQMPSAYKDMYGVGFCAVSRSVEIAQTLIDIIRYKQERLGSRPQNQMLIGKGVTGLQIMNALRMHEESLSNRGLSRYAKSFAIGSENTDIDVTKLDLNHLDPFDEETSMNLGMFAIASAFGMDADELWPVAGKSAGKAEANIRRMRARGRLPAQITSELRTQFGYKVLPPHLALNFDFKDDEEDMQQANIRDIRARNRERDLGDGSINIRGARLGMLDSGDLNRPTFEEMELSDGRLPDGSTLSMLFFSPDPTYERLLSFMDNPLQIVNNIMDIDEVTEMSMVNDAKLDTILGDIQAQRELVLATLARTASRRQSVKVRQSFFALDWLEEQYNFAAGRILPEVPMQARRMRTDLRVAPEEVSPAQGEQSPAEASMVQGENISNVGGS
jgi:hypothetical protein